MAILRRLNAEMCGSKCAVGPGGKTVGYLAHGTVTDWMYEEAGVAFASTWEIFGDFKAPYEECFQMFNPITKEVRERKKGTLYNLVFGICSLSSSLLGLF